MSPLWSKVISKQTLSALESWDALFAACLELAVKVEGAETWPIPFCWI